MNLFFRISGDFHSRVLAAIKRKELGEPGDQAVPKRKKKGVNPLACLKKKTPTPVKRLQSQGPARVEEDGGRGVADELAYACVRGDAAQVLAELLALQDLVEELALVVDPFSRGQAVCLRARPPEREPESGAWFES